MLKKYQRTVSIIHIAFLKYHLPFLDIKDEDKNVESGIKDRDLKKQYIPNEYSDTSEEQNGIVDIVQVNEAKGEAIATFHTQMEHEKHILQKEIENSIKKMSLHVDKLMGQTSFSGANFFGITQKKKAKPIFSEKVFEIKDSLLFESTKKGKEAHTVFNIIIAVLILIFVKMLAHDTIKGGHDFIDLTLIYDMLVDIRTTLILWIPSF